MSQTRQFPSSKKNNTTNQMTTGQVPNLDIFKFKNKTTDFDNE
uniref:Uncharacterized protein n=1 Tax=Zea mays TaxID=4577 RepID=C4J8C3_MAIZE|nr:unknown [Zea mays]